jgi:hypothetical protein
VVVRGLLDCLWRDKTGNWHLLVHDTMGSPTVRRTKTGQGRQLRLVFGAMAMQAQLGVAPKTARRYNWQAGKTSTWNEQRPQAETILAAVVRVLAES